MLKNGGTEILPEYRDSPRRPQEAMTQAANGSSHGHTVNNRPKTGGRTANTVSYSEWLSVRFTGGGVCIK